MRFRRYPSVAELREIAMKRQYDVIVVVGFNLKQDWSVYRWFVRSRKNMDMGDWLARQMCENLAQSEEDT